MHIVPPTPNIALYQDGFKGFDLLERSHQGKQLSDLVEKIEDPLVIAVDGSWGSGKSFFLKCWVGAHKNENHGSAETVYFDAFENDFLNDPLISLTSAIGGKIKKEPSTAKAWEKAKNAAAVLWRPATRISLAVATAGASENLGSIARAGIEASQGELEKQVEGLWKREECQKSAMNDFRQALIALTRSDSKSGKPTKLVVTIDELDRCRPDYALSILEVIKHFFNVAHVHFVLGVNIEELENSVRARYGESTNARLYLQKFISVTLNLSNELPRQRERRSVTKEYYEKKALEMDLNKRMIDEVAGYLDRPTVSNFLSLRSVERLLTQMALVPHAEEFFTKKVHGYITLLSGLIVLKTLFHKEYKAARDNQLTIEDIRLLFGIRTTPSVDEDHFGDIINQTWTYFLAPDEADQSDHFRSLFGLHGLHFPKEAFNKLLREYLETINFGSASG